MPKSKCIAYIKYEGKPDKRCGEPTGTGKWPQDVLCPTHWANLQAKDGSTYRFKTEYKDISGTKIGMCKGDGSRNIQAGEYYLCSEGTEGTRNGNPYDSCYKEYSEQLQKSIGSKGYTPRSPTAPTPRAGRAPSSFKFTDVENVCVGGEPQQITKLKVNRNILRSVKADIYKEESESESDKDEEQGEVGEEGEENKKPCEQDGLAGLMNRTYKPKRPTRAYAPQLNCKMPILFKKENSANLINLLQDIDRTRNVNEALRKIKMVMELISMQQEKAVGVDIDTYNYSVTEDVVNTTSQKFGEYMFNNERIELVLTFLYDYETRDMFNPMKFYGFSITESKTGPYLDILNATPYAILYAGKKTGFGQIEADIARPRTPSEFFADKIERIAGTIKTAGITQTGTVQQKGSDKTDSDGPGSKFTPLTKECVRYDDITNIITKLANLAKVKFDNTQTYLTADNKANKNRSDPPVYKLNQNVTVTPGTKTKIYSTESANSILTTLSNLPVNSNYQLSYYEKLFTEANAADSAKCPTNPIPPAPGASSPGLNTGGPPQPVSFNRVKNDLASIFKDNGYKFNDNDIVITDNNNKIRFGKDDNFYKALESNFLTTVNGLTLPAGKKKYSKIDSLGGENIIPIANKNAFIKVFDNIIKNVTAGAVPDFKDTDITNAITALLNGITNDEFKWEY